MVVKATGEVLLDQLKNQGAAFVILFVILTQDIDTQSGTETLQLERMVHTLEGIDTNHQKSLDISRQMLERMLQARTEDRALYREMLQELSARE